MSTEKWDPNRHSFEHGVGRVQMALSNAGIRCEDKIITSQDDGVRAVVEELRTDNVPEGFWKWQLPVVFDRALVYLSVGAPNARVESHAHEEGNGVRLIVSGSILFGDKELRAGDWMHIPQGAKYEFTVGPHGFTAFYCYRC